MKFFIAYNFVSLVYSVVNSALENMLPEATVRKIRTVQQDVERAVSLGKV